jgi:putative membrane protein
MVALMMGGFGMLSSLLFLVVVVVLIAWAVNSGILDRGNRGGSPRMQGRLAEEILKERFARGEIDVEEYEERRRILNEQTTSTADR